MSLPQWRIRPPHPGFENEYRHTEGAALALARTMVERLPTWLDDEKRVVKVDYRADPGTKDWRLHHTIHPRAEQ